MEVAGLTIGVANLISASTESLDRIGKLFKASGPSRKYGRVIDSILAELALLGTFHAKYMRFLIKGDESLRFSIFQLLGQQENVLNEMEFRYRKDQGHAIDVKDRCFYRSSWKILARTKQTNSLSFGELFRILKENNLQLKTVTILLESTSSSDDLRVRVRGLGLQNSLLSQIVTICLEALRLCETIYDSVFQEERIRLHAWARDTGMQEGILDKIITKEDEIRVTLYALFGNISLVICSALKPESNESNGDCSKVTDPGHQRHAENLWAELRLLADQAKKEVEDFDMYSLCEVGEALPMEEVMQELPGLVDELFGMSRALEQLFSEHSHEQNDDGCLRVVSNIVQGMEEESHVEGLEQCMAKLGVESPSSAGYLSGIELQISPPTPTNPVNCTKELPYPLAEDHLEIIKNSDFSKEPTAGTTPKTFEKGGEIDLKSWIRNASSEAPTQGVTIFDKILTACRWICEIFRPGQGTIETDGFGQQCIELHYRLSNTPMAQFEGLPHEEIAVSSIDVSVLLQLALVGVSNVLVRAVECECSTITITKEGGFGNRGALEDVKMVGIHLEALVNEALHDYPKMKRFVRKYGLGTGLSLLTSDLKAFNIVFLAAQEFVSPPTYKTLANPQQLASHKKALGDDDLGALKEMEYLAGRSFDQGRWKEAEDRRLQVVAISTSLLGENHPKTLMAKDILARTYFKLGDWNEAEALQLQVVTAIKKELGKDHPNTLLATGNLANTYYKQGRWKGAETLQLQVAAASERVLGVEHPDTLVATNNLANTRSALGNWGEAEAPGQRVLAVSKRALGDNHPNTVMAMSNLANTYFRRGRLNEAETLQLQAVTASKEVLGDSHPNTLLIMSNLASTYFRQGRWKEAEALLLKVVAASKVLGDDHPNTLAAINNLANIYSYLGNWEKAETSGQQVLTARKRLLGEDHPDTLSAMGNLAITYSRRGRWKEAEDLEVQVLAARKRILGYNHPDTLLAIGNLANTYRIRGCWEEAETLQLQAVVVSRKVLGSDHPNTLMAMSGLASTYFKQGRWEEAEAIQLQVVATSIEVLGDDHPSTLMATSNLANTYSYLGVWEMAEGPGRRVLAACRRLLGDEHPDTLSAMGNLAITYSHRGLWKEAEGLEIQVSVARKKLLGDQHPDTLTAMSNLASTYLGQGRWKDAEVLQLQTVFASKKVLGDEHPSTLKTMNNLASTCSKQGRWKEAEIIQLQVAFACKKVLGKDHPETVVVVQNLDFYTKRRLELERGPISHAGAVYEKNAEGDFYPANSYNPNELTLEDCLGITRESEPMDLIDLYT